MNKTEEYAGGVAVLMVVVLVLLPLGCCKADSYFAQRARDDNACAPWVLADRFEHRGVRMVVCQTSAGYVVRGVPEVKP